MSIVGSTPVDELYHHGIKGMKWGVRRYQNKDGTLTPKGRERYRDTETGGMRKDIRKYDQYQNEDGTLTALGRNRLRGHDDEDSYDYAENWYDAERYVAKWEREYGTTPINRLRFDVKVEDVVDRGQDYCSDSDWGVTSLESIYDAYQDYRDSNEWD